MRSTARSRRRQTATPALAILVASTLGVAGGIRAAERPSLLPRACEERLALAAAPEHLRAGAGLWLLGKTGYQPARESENGFTCLVNRDDPHSIKPVCFDKEGTQTIVPKILAVGAWLMQGLSGEEIEQKVEQGFAKGLFFAPEHPGVAYMLSHYNRPWNPRTGRLGWYPPHVMFLAPNATNANIGFSPEAYSEEAILPLAGYQGPHGFFIVRRQLTAEPWEHPVPECPAWVMGRHGELPPEAHQFDFWLGRWDVNLRIRKDGEWPPSTTRAITEIYSILDGKAILELWSSTPIKGYSLRYFDVARDEWVLWLNWPGQDRSGSSSLSGTFHHGRGDFYAESPTEDGGTLLSRYSFNDITPTSLRWDDAYSSDGGETWRHQWRMEFSRTAHRVALAADGGDAHTYFGGERCGLPEFRRFERLAGVHEGHLRVRDGATWNEAPARLVGYRALDGCAVLAFIESTLPEGAPESFHHLTWNTYASLFEETVLDSAPDTPAELYYGSADGGEVLLAPRDGKDAGPRSRRRWVVDEEHLELHTEVEGEDGQWRPVLEAGFDSGAPL
jgi:hypothetical protein